MAVQRIFINMPFTESVGLLSASLQARAMEISVGADGFDADIQLRKDRFTEFAGKVALDEPVEPTISNSWLPFKETHDAAKQKADDLRTQRQKINGAIVDEQQTVILLKRLGRVTAENSWLGEELIAGGKQVDTAAALLIGQLGVIVADEHVQHIATSLAEWQNSQTDDKLGAFQERVAAAIDIMTNLAPHASKDIVSQGHATLRIANETYERLHRTS